MRKKILFCAGFLTLALLCACNAKEDKEKLLMTPTPIAEKESIVTPILLPTESLTSTPEETEMMAWTELTCSADKKTSLRNSNLLNEGYLTYDENGNIYFVDMNIGGIFVSDGGGNDRRQLSMKNARDLQIEGEWLYCAMEDGLKRIHIHTGEEEVLYDAPYGEGMLADGKIYLNAEEGFIALDLEGKNKVVVRGKQPELVSYTGGTGFWLGTAIDGENMTYYLEGHLYGYDETTNKLSYMEKGCWYPLLAGHWLSVFDSVEGSRYVWNLETDEEVNLDVYAQKVVSDGTDLYYTRSSADTFVYRWNGCEAEEIMCIEKTGRCDYIYLTPEALYILPIVNMNGKTLTQLWFYELETGQIGQIY